MQRSGPGGATRGPRRDHAQRLGFPFDFTCVFTAVWAGRRLVHGAMRRDGIALERQKLSGKRRLVTGFGNAGSRPVTGFGNGDVKGLSGFSRRERRRRRPAGTFGADGGHEPSWSSKRQGGLSHVGGRRVATQALPTKQAEPYPSRECRPLVASPPSGDDEDAQPPHRTRGSWSSMCWAAPLSMRRNMASPRSVRVTTMAAKKAVRNSR